MVSEVKSVVNAKTDFGALGDGMTSDTQALQNAFNYCSQNHATLFIPNGNYVFSNLVATGSFEITGEHRYYTVLKSTGTNGAGLDFSGLSNIKLSNLTVTSFNGNEALEYGMKFGSATGEGLGNIILDNIEVKNLSRANAVGCFMENINQISVNSSIFLTSNGTGFAIGGATPGVYNFSATNFRGALFGFEIMDNANIDSVVFEGCYFGAGISSERIGNGNNRSIIHMGCHYENNSEGETQHVEIGENCSGISWENCSFIGFNKCKSVVNFKGNGIYKGISLKDCEFNSMATGGSIINNTLGTYENCEINLGYSENTLPVLFAKETSRDSGEWIQGWTVTAKYTDFQSSLKIGGARVLAVPDMPDGNVLRVTGSFNPGDLVYFVGAPEEYTYEDGSKYIIEGWKRITSGNSNVIGIDWVELRVFTGN